VTIRQQSDYGRPEQQDSCRLWDAHNRVTAKPDLAKSKIRHFGQEVSPRGWTGTWAPTAVREMLRRSLYAGVVIWNNSQKITRWGTSARHRGHRPLGARPGPARPAERHVSAAHGRPVDRPALRGRRRVSLPTLGHRRVGALWRVARRHDARAQAPAEAVLWLPPIPQAGRPRLPERTLDPPDGVRPGGA
jgi:hypothetical protein